ncbi:MAG: hypothetical protein NTW38_04730 [Candidatus Aminicenantes bacterium]|nr:hypothetical protein [Candidatus Aminicenantes bacterium]
MKSRSEHGLENGKDQPVARTSRKKSIIAAAILIAAAVTGFIGLKALRILKSGAAVSNLGPVRCALKGKSLVFYDSTDRFLWDWPVDLPKELNKYRFNSLIARATSTENFCSSCVDFADVDNDGRNEAAAFLFEQNARKRTIVLFDHDGKKILWEHNRPFPCLYPDGAADHDPYVRSISFHQIPGRDAPSLCVCWSIFRFAPSSFEILDGKNGEVFFYYDHVGTLVFFKKANLGGRPYFFLGGTNDLANGDGACVVLNSADLQSGLGPPYASDVDSGPAAESISPALLKHAVRASQVQYIKIRRTPLSEALGTQKLYVTDAAIEGSRFFLTVEISRGILLYYYFDSTFRFLEVRPSADFVGNFDLWRQTGKVRISREEYLRQRGEDVSYWNGEGWQADPDKS